MVLTFLFFALSLIEYEATGYRHLVPWVMSATLWISGFVGHIPLIHPQYIPTTPLLHPYCTPNTSLLNPTTPVIHP